MFKKPLTIFFLILIVLFLTNAVPVMGQQGEQYTPHKPLEYEVSIRARILPVFALDGQGKPVFDLKRGDLELYVNGKPQEIGMFTRFKFVDHRKRVHVIKQPERVNFIIIDSVLNTRKGLHRAVKIAGLLVDKASPGDSFVIYESNRMTGLRYVIGPEKDKTKLAAAIDGVLPSLLKRRAGTGQFRNSLSHGLKEVMVMIHLYSKDGRKVRIDRMEYQRDIQVLSHSLTQFKYGLKSVSAAKSVFLISAGLAKSAHEIDTAKYYKFLEDAGKAINYGGSMLYVINPLEGYSQGTYENLKFMADKSGGKYFFNSDVKNLVKEIKKSTAAYYEIAFFPAKDTEEKSEVQLKSKRKGITLHTINYSEREKPYREMESTQKKLFALNVVYGGSWSRIAGRAVRLKYKEVENQNPDTKGAKKNIKTIEFNIPPFMAGQPVDLFQVVVDPNTLDADVTFREEVLEEKAKIEMAIKKNRDHYFVVIEPKNTFCIYNQVTRVPVPEKAAGGSQKTDDKQQKTDDGRSL